MYHCLKYLIAICSLFIVTVHAHSSDIKLSGRTKGLTVEQGEFFSLNIPKKAKDWQVQVRMAQSHDYRIGELAKIFIEVDRSAYITVLNIDALGEKTLLFPNRFSPNNFISQAGQIQIPTNDKKFKLRVREPYGPNMILVFASENNIDFVPKAKAAPHSPFKSSEQTSKEIVDHINQDPMLQSEIWTAAQTNFQVVGSSTDTQIHSTPLPTPKLPIPEIDTGNYHLSIEAINLDPLKLKAYSEKLCDLRLIVWDSKGNHRYLKNSHKDSVFRLPAQKMYLFPEGGRQVFFDSISSQQHLIGVCMEVDSFFGDWFGRKKKDKSELPKGSELEVINYLLNHKNPRIARTIVRR